MKVITLDSLIIAYRVAFGRPISTATSPQAAVAEVQQYDASLLDRVQADQVRRLKMQCYQRARLENPAHQYEWLANDFCTIHNYPVIYQGVACHA